MPDLNAIRPEAGGFGFGRSEADVADAPPPARLKITDAASLRDAHRDWRFFTHAVLLRYGRFPHDPVQEWVNTQPGPAPVAIVTSGRYIFSGLGNFNHSLFACEREKWLDLRRFLGGVAAVDRDKKEFFRAFWHRIRIKDHLALRNKATLPDPIPTVPVTVFGVASTRVAYYITEAPDMVSVPAVATRYATADDRQMGLSVLFDAPVQAGAPAPVGLKWNPATEFFDPVRPGDVDDETEEAAGA